MDIKMEMCKGNNVYIYSLRIRAVIKTSSIDRQDYSIAIRVN